VVGIDILVPEVSGQLKDLFKTTNYQPLEIEFGSNPHEEILLELMVERGEWPGIGTPVYRLQDRCLEFKEAAIGQVAADEGHYAAPCPEGLSNVVVHDEIHISLAVPLLHVLQTVKLFGKGAQRLGKERDRVHPQRDLSNFCTENMSADSYDVTPLGCLKERVERLLPHVILPYIELDAATPVLKIGKNSLPMVSYRIQAPGGAYSLLTLFVPYPGMPLLDGTDGLPAFEFRRVEGNT